jgi:hypothetical protein
MREHYFGNRFRSVDSAGPAINPVVAWRRSDARVGREYRAVAGTPELADRRASLPTLLL